MFAGKLGAGLMLKRPAPGVSLAGLLFAVMTVTGLLVPMPPQEPAAAALSWILTPVLLAALAVWIERNNNHQAAR